MNNTCWLRIVQPALDVAFVCAVTVLALGFGGALQSLFAQSLWSVAVPLGAAVPAGCLVLIKFALYVVPLWNKRRYADPSWHHRIQWTPLLFSAAEVPVVIWLFVLGLASGNAQKHLLVADHVPGVVAVVVLFVAATSVAGNATTEHRRVSAQSVFGGGATQFQTNLDEMDDSAVSATEPRVRGARDSALMQSEQSSVELQPLVELAPNAEENTEDEESEELYGKTARPTRMFGNGFNRRKGRPRRKGE